MFPTKFPFIWPSGFRREDVLEINQSETRVACGGHVFVSDRNEMSNLYRGHSIDASYQISVYLGKRFQRKIYLEINRSETRMACDGHVC